MSFQYIKVQSKRSSSKCNKGIKRNWQRWKLSRVKPLVVLWFHFQHLITYSWGVSSQRFHLPNHPTLPITWPIATHRTSLLDKLFLLSDAFLGRRFIFLTFLTSCALCCIFYIILTALYTSFSGVPCLVCQVFVWNLVNSLQGHTPVAFCIPVKPALCGQCQKLLMGTECSCSGLWMPGWLNTVKSMLGKQFSRRSFSTEDWDALFQIKDWQSCNLKPVMSGILLILEVPLRHILSCSKYLVSF